MGDSSEDSEPDNQEQDIRVAEGVDDSSDGEEAEVEDEERADHIGVDSKRLATYCY